MNINAGLLLSWNLDALADCAALKLYSPSPP